MSPRRNENGGHHGEASEGRRDHVRHDVAVVVLQGPEHPPFGADDSCRSVVDEGEEIPNPCCLKLLFPVLFVLRLEDVPEAGIVGLRDGVLRAEPEVHLLV